MNSALPRPALPCSVLAAALLLVSPAVGAEPLTLAQALELARTHHPTLRSAHATTEAADAQVTQALAPQLPQVSLGAGYSRSTANFAARPGAVPNSIGSSESTFSLTSYDFFNGNLSASQNLWDFQQTWGRYRAAQATAEGRRADERTSLLTVSSQVRAAYFGARAQGDLVEVAEAALKNQQAHLDQIGKFVEVGKRPEIDLAQARSDVAQARLQQLIARSALRSALATLNQAIGREADLEVTPTDAALAPVEGEGGAMSPLLDRALAARPEFASLEATVKAQQLQLEALRGGYLPSLSASVGTTLQGRSPAALVPNASAGLNLSWQLFSGFQTDGQVAEARARLAQLEAQRDTLKLQVRLDLEQARIALANALETVTATAEATTAARERLTLAEARYAQGVGSTIELGDAQVALTTAEGQRVKATFDVAIARARLLAALGS